MPAHFENLFYHPAYIEIQAHSKLRIFEDDHFRILFSIQNDEATSLPRGLFGSFELKQKSTQRQFSAFANDVIQKFNKEGVRKIVIFHPPDFYAGFVPADWLPAIGFSEKYAEINHHIELDNFQMHSMELRKLEKLKKGGLVIKKLTKDHLMEVYDFLTRCRKEKGLELNVSYEKLAKLFHAYPDRYSIFGAYLANQLISAVITVQIADDIVYYYLPGTSEAFKKESPMVGLIQYLVDHFKTDMKCLDLGVSSIEGKPQEGLIAFKERMGGVREEKKYFQYN